MRRILVIEDDLSVSAAIRLTLEGNGNNVAHVHDARAGIDAFDPANFDLVIVDLFMPEINGLFVIAEFRDRAPLMPIIAMSGFRFRDYMDANLDFLGLATKVGATGTLSKPFTSTQLLAAIGACRGQAVGAREKQIWNQKDCPDDAEPSTLRPDAVAESA